MQMLKTFKPFKVWSIFNPIWPLEAKLDILLILLTITIHRQVNELWASVCLSNVTGVICMTKWFLENIGDHGPPYLTFPDIKSCSGPGLVPGKELGKGPGAVYCILHIVYWIQFRVVKKDAVQYRMKNSAKQLSNK